MLRRLRLEEFVILAEAEVAFGPGLNVVTGETGTGKSILCDAIGYLAGGRGEASWVRSGAGGMGVEAEFGVDRLPAAAALAARLGAPAKEGSLHVRREMARSGRSRAWVQGRAVRQSDLRQLGAQLLAIHGQGEHRRLLIPAVQLELVDRFAGAMGLRGAYAAARGRWIEERARHDEARRRLAELAEKEAWFREQAEEIDEAAIRPGEEEELRETRDRLQKQGRQVEVHGLAGQTLFEEEGSALERIETVLDATGGLEGLWVEFRSEVGAAREALRRSRRILPEPEEIGAVDLDRIEERLGRIGRLKRKYGGSEEAILERRASLAALLEEHASLTLAVERIARDLEKVCAEAAEAAVSLRRARAEAVGPLCRAIESELRQLGMVGASLTFVLEEEDLADGPGLPVEGRSLRAFADGVERGFFRLRPNPGEGAGPLGSVASGGELSRCMLALLTILGGREEPRSAIFDEVDTGVGGATARVLAVRLERLASERQVLLVTHLPLVACRAAHHFRVEKGERGGRTFATIVPLDRKERIGEVARMLAGEVDSSIARQHAEELLSEASSLKESR